MATFCPLLAKKVATKKCKKWAKKCKKWAKMGNFGAKIALFLHFFDFLAKWPLFFLFW